VSTFCIITSANFGEYSGVQKYVLDLARFIIYNNRKVTLVTRTNSIPPVSVLVFENPNQFSRFNPHKLKKTNVNAGALSSPIYTLLFFVFATIKVIRTCERLRVSIIHAQDVFFSGFAGTIAHKLFRIPLIVHAHGPSPYFFEATSEATKLHRILMHILAKLVIHNSDLVLATDIHTKKLLSPFLGKTKCVCIPTPIETKVYSKKTGTCVEVARAWNEGLILGFIGRLSPQKNLGTLLSAFASARASLNMKLKLVIVGKGPERSFLMREARQLKVNKEVNFTGAVAENKKIELLNGLDVFLMPSLYEGCPIALLEAMASGKAIISSDIPSIREIVRHNEEAILVNPFDVEELKQAILLLYNNRSLRIKLGNKARERAKLYDANNVFNHLLETYRKLICHAR